MRYLIIIIYCFVTFFCKGQMQVQGIKQNDHCAYKPLANFNKDTAAYLAYNFIQHKERYVNKPLSFLLDDLKISIVSYTNMIVETNKFIYKGITLYSYDNNKSIIRKRLHLKPFNLIIIWTKPVLQELVNPYIVKNKGYWTKDEIELFKNQIISDILQTAFIHPEHYYD